MPSNGWAKVVILMYGFFPQSSGLIMALADLVPDLRNIPPMVLLAIISLMVATLTEVMSNSVITAILLPILANVVCFTKPLVSAEKVEIWTNRMFKMVLFSVRGYGHQSYLPYVGRHNGQSVRPDGPHLVLSDGYRV